MNRLEDLDELLARARVVIVVGTGGVGKTTTSGALGVRAANRLGRRVLVLTVDPARRLADALGVDDEAQEAVAVPVDRGQLWVRMVDMTRSWERLVVQCAPDRATRDELLANRLFRSLTANFIASHDYIALDQLYDLRDDDRYDLVIVDTPPSAHVLDLIDAPVRMATFLESRLLDVLTGGSVGRGLGQWAAKPFLLLSRRVLGSDFLAQISRFFLLLRRLGPAFRRRSATVQDILLAPSTGWLAVTTASGQSDQEYRQLIEGLTDRAVEVDLVVLNRSLRAAIKAEGPVEELAGLTESEVKDRRLERAMAQWARAAVDEPEVVAIGSAGVSPVPVVAVSIKNDGVDGVEDLQLFFD